MDDYDRKQPWNRYAGWHIIQIELRKLYGLISTCAQCGKTNTPHAKYCIECGRYIYDDTVTRLNDVVDGLATHLGHSERLSPEEQKIKADYVFPASGIYIYYHPYEKYKIGKGEKIVQRRIPTHQCSAPSLELLHVIETSDMDWCERFLHERFRHRRIFANHEYFDLTEGDLRWLFAIKVLEPPRSEATQHSLLDLL